VNLYRILQGNPQKQNSHLIHSVSLIDAAFEPNQELSLEKAPERLDQNQARLLLSGTAGIADTPDISLVL
jgi:hypothetical protein